MDCVHGLQVPASCDPGLIFLGQGGWDAVRQVTLGASPPTSRAGDTETKDSSRERPQGSVLSPHATCLSDHRVLRVHRDYSGNLCT